MKKMKNQLLILLAFSLTLIIGCEKEPIQEELETLTTSQLNGYDMVSVSSDGTFVLNDTTFRLKTYLTGDDNLKSAAPGQINNKTYFKPFIYGNFNERLNMLKVKFPPGNSDNTILFEENNFHFGEWYHEFNFIQDSLNNISVIDTVTFYNWLKVDTIINDKQRDSIRVFYDSIVVYNTDELMILAENIDEVNEISTTSHVSVEQEYEVVDNIIHVSYNDIHYSFNMTVLRIEANEKFIEAVVDEVDTVLFFNEKDYFDNNDRTDPEELFEIYKLADEWNYYSNSTNHITDSTIASRCWVN